jgi:RNA polymerase sigma-70 factor (ECF subfamily)
MEPSHALSGDDRDADWIRRMASGDEMALEEMLKAYNQRLAGYLYNAMGFTDHRDCEDVINAWALAVFKSAHRFRGEARPFVWAITILRYLAFNHMRRYGKRERVADLPSDDATAIQESTEKQMALKEALGKALPQLSAKSREALQLVAVGFSGAEIKRVQNDFLESNVRKRIFRNRQHMRTILATMGIERP